ncbi:MAG: DUF4139 domain-containing protein [Planctomycetota bacterium]|nr:DUF4139 domain-containing protein [Planctomycetota bacterium]
MVRKHQWTPNVIAAVILLFSPCTVGAAAAGEGLAVTVYSTADPASFDPQRFISQQRQGYNLNFAWQVPGFGVVKEVRTVNLKAGLNELRFTDVAQFIDPTTVSFVDLTDPDGTEVLEQNFEFDLINTQKLYEKYIDREVGLEVTQDGETTVVTGKVLAVRGGMFILQTPQGLEFLPQGSGRIKLPPLPLEGLVTKPTLVWKLDAEQGGEHEIRTTYQTSGITWRADYNLMLNADDTQADLAAWVTVMNLSGRAYQNARLKLIAGDVQRVQPEYGFLLYSGTETLGRAGRAAGFQEKAFFEYHLYTLPRRTDILSNTTQQITLFPTARDVSVEKVLVYFGLSAGAGWGFSPNPRTDRNLGTQSNPKVDVYVRFQNEEDNNLGMPLPRGKVRVYKRDEADETLEFVGEDLIDHTPKNEKVLIRVGQAFDIVGERTQTNFTIDTQAHLITESFQIQIRNHKEQQIKVIIKENLYRWVNWQITEASDEHEKIDARTIHFEVNVPPDGEKTVIYTVKYTW